MKLIARTLGIVASIALAVPAAAQTDARPVSARQAHYQIGVMERVLEGAVEHGAANLRERLQAVFPDAPAELLILDNPRVRGFRLDGYGVFFHVEVPSLNGTLTWSLRTLDQNDLGLQSALNTLRTHLNTNDVDIQQALKRVELQVSPTSVAQTAASSAPAPLASPAVPRLPNVRRATGSAASAADPQVTATAVSPKLAQGNDAATDDKLLENPNEAYRTEVVQTLADAMLDHSGGLGIGPDEWLTVAARGIQDQPRIGPPDNDSQTIMIRLRGSDLAAFRANQISRDEVIKRMDRRVF